MQIARLIFTWEHNRRQPYEKNVYEKNNYNFNWNDEEGSHNTVDIARKSETDRSSPMFSYVNRNLESLSPLFVFYLWSRRFSLGQRWRRVFLLMLTSNPAISRSPLECVHIVIALRIYIWIFNFVLYSSSSNRQTLKDQLKYQWTVPTSVWLSIVLTFKSTDHRSVLRLASILFSYRCKSSFVGYTGILVPCRSDDTT